MTVTNSELLTTYYFVYSYTSILAFQLCESGVKRADIEQNLLRGNATYPYGPLLLCLRQL